MLSRAYLVGDCLVGCIYGTGTNAAYIDDIGTFAKLPEDVRKRGGKMVVNTEWGAFDNAVCHNRLAQTFGGLIDLHREEYCRPPSSTTS
jgi:hexokinase